jgi:hypothetical protein
MGSFFIAKNKKKNIIALAREGIYYKFILEEESLDTMGIV